MSRDVQRTVTSTDGNTMSKRLVFIFNKFIDPVSVYKQLLNKDVPTITVVKFVQNNKTTTMIRRTVGELTQIRLQQ